MDRGHLRLVPGCILVMCLGLWTTTIIDVSLELDSLPGIGCLLINVPGDIHHGGRAQSWAHH